MLASDRYFEITGKKHVYNIMPIANIPSVLEHGIVCFDRMKQIDHASIAMSEIQSRRAAVVIPKGLPLHCYSNLYFSHHNPMLFKRKDIAEELCILALWATVLDIDGCIVSDRNAAAQLARFYAPQEGLEHLNFDLIHAQYWTDPNRNTEREKKQIKCAEVLIPNAVPHQYIAAACVVNATARAALLEQGFDQPIYIQPKTFFR